MTAPQTPDQHRDDAPRRGELFRNPGFGFYVLALFLSNLATHIQTVAVGWQVYDVTRDPFMLGLVGLSQFAPALVFVLFTGSVADRYSRRLVMALCALAMALSSAGILLVTLGGHGSVFWILMMTALFGLGRAFFMPVRQAIVSNLVPRAQLSRAMALNGSVNQFAAVFGPLAGGLLYAVAPEAAYGVALAALLLAAGLALALPPLAQRISTARQSWTEITAGFRYIRSNPILLGVITLDLLVVLLGGAFAMLPVYARDVLDVGSVGLGLLRAAPALGAIVMAAWLLRYPVRRRAGTILFATVAVFCVATLVFALSTVVLLSILALAVVGGADMISVVLRATLVQVNTPDELRGRVNAVNQTFIGASNEVGGFRAGSMAAMIGVVPAVAGGALVALGICGLWMRLFPQLRAADDPADGPPPPPAVTTATTAAQGPSGPAGM